MNELIKKKKDKIKRIFTYLCEKFEISLGKKFSKYTII